MSGMAQRLSSLAVGLRVTMDHPAPRSWFEAMARYVESEVAILDSGHQGDALDRSQLAKALNEYEEVAGFDPWPTNNPATHRPDCIHVGYVADRYDASQGPLIDPAVIQRRLDRYVAKAP